jgi:hypothetical protein
MILVAGIFWLKEMSMATVTAYDEIVDFIAAGSTPMSLIAFRPSETTRSRVYDLLSREKTNSLTHEESAELTNYLHMEHIMRLIKARARQFIAGDQSSVSTTTQ